MTPQPPPSSQSVLVAWLDRETAIVGGVAHRVASVGGMHRLLVRVCFVVLVLAGGAGVVLYGLGWILTVGRPRPKPKPTQLRNDLALMVFAMAVVSASTELVRALPAPLLWLVCMGTLALAIATTAQLPADDAAGDRARDVVFGAKRARTLVGMILVVAAVFTALAATQSIAQLWQSLTAIAVLIIGLGLVLAPWLSQLTSTAERERLERIRAEERADITAHLHDSVLQTLTLIQNRAAEPQVTAALAHQQERELRQWLYGSERPDPDATATLRTMIERVGAEIEDQYLVAVDTVVIGNHEYTPTMHALVAAMREALVNAAKFSQSQLISVFAELTDEMVTVFVRDRGVGFELDEVPPDRHGVTESIVGRCHRLGGSAVIRTAPGEGTEVALAVPTDMAHDWVDHQDHDRGEPNT